MSRGMFWLDFSKQGRTGLKNFTDFLNRYRPSHSSYTVALSAFYKLLNTLVSTLPSVYVN